MSEIRHIFDRWATIALFATVFSVVLLAESLEFSDDPRLYGVGYFAIGIIALVMAIRAVVLGDVNNGGRVR